MNLAEAQALLEARKLEGPITEPWVTYTDEGITLTALPLGMAFGSWTPFAMITAHPHYQYSALFHGVGSPHYLKVPRLAAHHLWEQEWYVYQRERRSAVVRALEQLDRAPFMRRKSESEKRDYPFMDVDNEPHAEDFAGGYGTIKTKMHSQPAVEWSYEGTINVSQREIRDIKFEFRTLLAEWIETH